MRRKLSITVDVNEDGGPHPFIELLKHIEVAVQKLNIKSPSGKSYHIVDATWTKERNKDDPY